MKLFYVTDYFVLSLFNYSKEFHDIQTLAIKGNVPMAFLTLL